MELAENFWLAAGFPRVSARFHSWGRTLRGARWLVVAAGRVTTTTSTMAEESECEKIVVTVDGKPPEEEDMEEDTEEDTEEEEDTEAVSYTHLTLPTIYSV